MIQLVNSGLYRWNHETTLEIITVQLKLLFYATRFELLVKQIKLENCLQGVVECGVETPEVGLIANPTIPVLFVMVYLKICRLESPASGVSCKVILSEASNRFRAMLSSLQKIMPNSKYTRTLSIYVDEPSSCARSLRFLCRKDPCGRVACKNLYGLWSLKPAFKLKKQRKDEVTLTWWCRFKPIFLTLSMQNPKTKKINRVTGYKTKYIPPI